MDQDGMAVAKNLFIGGGEMGALMRSYDWTKTPFGSLEQWPQSLRSALSICLNSRFPIAIYWGPDCLLLYNDAWRPIVGNKHPWSLGCPGREVWPEIWNEIGPEFATVFTTGEGIFHSDELLAMHRFGYTEECFFDYTFNPIQGEGGVVDGILNVVSETTYRVLNDRRAQFLREVASGTGTAKTVEEACTLMTTVLRSAPADIPFSLLYLIDPEGKQARLWGGTESTADSPVAPRVVDLESEDDPKGWPIARVARTACSEVVNDLGRRFGVLRGSPCPEPYQEAMILPIATTGQGKVCGVLIGVASPRRRLDDNYRDFFVQVAGQIATVIANARAYEEERRRAEQLAELDRAKTVFFSNVSHEFRTPLTLMLGPVEDALRETQDTQQRERLELVHRNALRLQKLVNTLLDFSRIEAGRIEAIYEPTDLARLTTELASVFRSAIERAGLRLVVDCPPLPEPVYVDREMWEKILLNLLSNAFKFTFVGEIAVVLRSYNGRIELEVRDTGTGIPTDELPHIFKRFHRVKGASGRSYEGSGIGLSLVQELVKLQGGMIEVSSEVDQGTCFTISIPTGYAHLPTERLQTSRTLNSTAIGAASYVEEAWRWLPEEERVGIWKPGSIESLLTRSSPPPFPNPSSLACARILIADDNADIRNYLKHLLNQQYEVEVVGDGVAAWAAIRQQKPDLLLSDVMMPKMDGFELLQSLRSNPTTQAIPIILLSARAGEESRIEGLEAGADDYLTKPFSARELLARVEACLKLAQLRQEAAQKEQALRVEVQAAKNSLEKVLTRIKDQFLALDCEWRYNYVNDRVTEVTGIARENLLGRCIWDIFPELAGTRFYTEVHRAVTEQTSVQFEYFYPLWNRWFENHVHPSADGVSIIVTEITDRKLAEAALQDSEELKRRILENSKDCIKFLTLNSEIVYISPGGLSLLEIEDPTSILNSIWADLWQGEDHENAKAAIAAATLGNTGQFQGYLPTAKDTAKWWDSIITPVRDASGAIVHLVAISRDITEAKHIENQRQQAEMALREAHVQLEAALMAGAVYTWRWNISDNRIVVNAAFAHLVAVDPAKATSEGLPPEFFVNAMHEDDRPRVLAAIEQAIETGNEFTAEYRVLTATHEARWVSARGRVEYDPAGKPIAFPGALADITQRKRAEEDRDRFFQLSRDMLAIINTDGDFLQVNPAWTEFLGYTAQELTAQPYLEFVHPEDRAATSNEAQLLAQGIPTRVFENRYRCRDGFYRWISWSVAPFLEQGLLYCVARDVTEYKLAEAEREQLLLREQSAREEAEAVNRIKDEFLAVLSHELRSPLNPILGWSALLQSKKLDEAKTAQALATIQRNAKLQSELVEDLLDVSRILRGKLSLNVAQVDPASTLRAAMETVRLAAEAKSIRVEASLEPEVGLVSGDSTRLQQVMWNLLSNAVKFTPPGGRVHVRLERLDACAQLTVSDTGQGISADFLPYVFDYFRQADGATTRRFGGLGLGLAIVRHLVELHGGTVRAESLGEGQGATFTVQLPLMPSQLKANLDQRPTEKRLDLHDIKILLVEDGIDTRELVAFLLEEQGAQVTAVSSAQSALTALAQSKPDVLLSDIGMPEMDGYMLIQQVRMLAPEQGGQIPAIALTAYAGETYQQQVIAAGFQKHIAKPIEPEVLVQAIASLVHSRFCCKNRRSYKGS